MFRPAPRVYATVRRDGSGEISFNGVSTVVKGESLQEAGSLAVAMVAQKAAQWGKPLRMTAQSPIDTRVLMVHPDGRLTDAKDRWWRPGSLLIGGAVTAAVALAVWLWLVPAVAGNDQISHQASTVLPAATGNASGSTPPTPGYSAAPSPWLSPESTPPAKAVVPSTPQTTTVTPAPAAEPLVGATGAAARNPEPVKTATSHQAKTPKPKSHRQVPDQVKNQPTGQPAPKSAPRPGQPPSKRDAVVEVG